LKSTVLPQAEAKGSTQIMVGFLDVRLRQHYQFLMLAFFVKQQDFEKELMKNEIAVNAKSHTSISSRVGTHGKFAPWTV
jgi:hypothetical protein